MRCCDCPRDGDCSEQPEGCENFKEDKHERHLREYARQDDSDRNTNIGQY